MPQLEISENELIVHLDKWEQFFSFIHKVRVPLAHIISARENDGLDNLKLGWRVPGNHVPFVIAAGTSFRRVPDSSSIGGEAFKLS